MKKVALMLMLFSITVTSFASDLKNLGSVGQGGKFSSSYQCKVFGKLDVAISCATGAGIQDSYTNCKNYPCETCAIQNIEITDKAESESFAIAFVTVNIQGLNCK